MAIKWNEIGILLKKRRERLKMTQDMLAAKAGVRLATIGRLEIGRIRPSLTMLEKLAGALRCRVRDLLPEGNSPLQNELPQHEPSMKGAPSYFRYGVADAAECKVIGRDVNTGRPIRATYFNPGWHLAIHIHEYLTEEAWNELENLYKNSQNGNQLEFRLIEFLKRELPGCMSLIPHKRYHNFIQGFLTAIEDGRTSLTWAVSHLLDSGRR